MGITGTDDFQPQAEICRVLADPKRLAVLDALRDGERSVGDLSAALGCTLPNVSQHLAVMRAAGLVETRRAGTVVHYRLAEPEILQACEIVTRIVARRLQAVTERRDATLDTTTTPTSTTTLPPIPQR